jgi:hypothetical protein
VVKDEGNQEVLSGKNRYFLHYKNYSILQDPVKKNNYLITLYVPIREFVYNRPGLKQSLPIHPNCNTVDINEKNKSNVIKNIKQEFGQIGTFHLDSQGIKIICKDVEISDTGQRVAFNITNLANEGIVDGANLYLAINELTTEEISKHSYVKVEIHVLENTNISDNMTESLDSKISLDNKVNLTKKELYWLEEIVEQTDYKDKIDLIDVLCYINLLRNNYYDADVSNQPTDSYWNKQKVKEVYKKNPSSFAQFGPLVKDILYLHDYINFKTQELWPNKRGSLNSLGLTTKYKQKAYSLEILDKKLDYKLHEAVLCVLLNGFRSFVIFNPDRSARWSKDFDEILKIYDTVILEIITIIKDYSTQLGHNPHLLGKNAMLYSIVYKEFMMSDLLNQFL